MKIRVDGRVDGTDGGVVTVSNLELTEAYLVHQTDKVLNCCECLQAILDGDNVIVIYESQAIVIDGIVKTSLQEPYVIHLQNKRRGSCLEDFSNRLLAKSTGSLETSTLLKDDKPVKGDKVLKEQLPESEVDQII